MMSVSSTSQKILFAYALASDANFLFIIPIKTYLVNLLVAVFPIPPQVLQVWRVRQALLLFLYGVATKDAAPPMPDIQARGNNAPRPTWSSVYHYLYVLAATALQGKDDHI